VECANVSIIVVELSLLTEVGFWNSYKLSAVFCYFALLLLGTGGLTVAGDRCLND
jgi:hypothetical protein